MNNREKLAALREEMKRENLDAYYLNTADPHQSEYVGEAFKDRAWLTGFSGSVGTALITQKEALLWVDGRYFIQAEREIEGSGFKMMKMDTVGYPSLLEWIGENLPHGSRIGMNAWTIAQAAYEEFATKLKEKDYLWLASDSLLARIWTDRPALPSGKAFLHETRFSGKTTAEKLADCRAMMKKDQVQATVVVGLDDNAWLFNYRGRDIPHTPVVLAYALITEETAELFLDMRKTDAAFRGSMSENGVNVRDYRDIDAALQALDVKRVAINKRKLSHALYRLLNPHMEILDRMDYPTHLKCSLNPVEMANLRRAQIRESAVFTRFLFWLRREATVGCVDEWQAAKKLSAMRAAQENYLEDSFTTISAYGANAAMMHYAPSETNCSRVGKRGFYLCDSGGQYLDGATDLTRTISLGDATEMEKRDFTLTLKAKIALSMAVFLEGSSGHYLDSLARQPLWRYQMDYKCGTGHSVGYVLGVHEGPQRFGKQASDTAISEGNFLTIEPGVYKEGEYGIRLENNYLVRKDKKIGQDQFLSFETISFVPIDRRSIDPSLLNREEMDWLNLYHEETRAKLMPLMETEEERRELEEATQLIG